MPLTNETLVLTDKGGLRDYEDNLLLLPDVLLGILLISFFYGLANYFFSQVILVINNYFYQKN